MSKTEKSIRVALAFVLFLIPGLILILLEYLGERSKSLQVDMERWIDRVHGVPVIRGKRHSRFCACVVCRRNKIGRLQ